MPGVPAARGWGCAPVTVVFIADGVAVAVLAATACAANRLPLDLPHVLAVQAATAVVTVIFLTELARVHERRNAGGEGQ